MKNPKKYYKWELDLAMTFRVGIRGVSFDSEWLTLTPEGWLTAKDAYAWNGASPKWKIGGVVIGTWDGFKTEDGYQQLYYPTLVHDALHQIWRKTGKAFDIKLAHKDFLCRMRVRKFILRRLYYLAVCLFVR